MKYIDKLLQGAPVEWKTLGEVAEIKRGTMVTKKNSNTGEFPVISGGQQPAYYIDRFNRTGSTITIAGSGAYAGFIMYWEKPIFVCDAFSIKTDELQISLRYIYHYLVSIQNKIYQLKTGSGVPHVYPKDVARFPIPITPLAVQEEVVRVLDTFTTLEAELEAELDCRKRQYQYYRDALLSFVPDSNDGLCHSPLIPTPFAVEWRPLSEITTKVDKIKWGSILMTEQYEYIDLSSIDIKTSQIIDTAVISSTNHPSRAQQIVKTNDILFGTTRPTLMRCCLIPQYYDNQICSTGYCVIRPDTTIVHPHLIYHVLSSSAFRVYVERFQEGEPYPSISDKLILSYSIPIPPLAVQERIVEMLDKFDTLVHSISEGLPREIALRRKQYEYYRDALLTF